MTLRLEVEKIDSFEDRRLALRALGVKVYANGDDPDGRRYETSIKDGGERRAA